MENKINNFNQVNGRIGRDVGRSICNVAERKLDRISANPTLIYGYEMRILRKESERLEAQHLRLLRSVVRYTLRDHVRSEKLREQLLVRDTA